MNKNNFEQLPRHDKLLSKIMAFYATIWKDRRQDGIHNIWLDNFKNDSSLIAPTEKLNALFLLSKFMYFGNLEMRELLKCIYRDLFKYPIISYLRKTNSNTTDINFLNKAFELELKKTRFLGVGNPSESGVHLLYYFRQENELHKDLFINTHEIIKSVVKIERDENGGEKRYLKASIKDKSIKRYIFLDDFCGSGTQAKQYSSDFVEKLKKLDSSIEINYLMLFGTKEGIKEVRDKTKFDRIEAIFTIDDTFKCFSDSSRYFMEKIEGINKEDCKVQCTKYGNKIYPSHPLGYKDGQLLLGFFHNTPDNTLPIFWCDSENWKPIFKRYSKI
jgi:hypothetical protein